MIKLIIIFTILLTSILAKATEFKTYGGGYIGANSLTVDNAELDKSGYNFGVKLVGSLEFEKSLVDLSVGWQYNFMSGKENSVEVDVTTKSAFIDLDVLGKVSDSINLGVTTSLQLGVDNTYEEKVGGSSTVVLAGVKAHYNFKIKGLDSRLEVSGLTNVTNSEYQNLIANVGLQVELPFFKKKEAPRIVRIAPPPTQIPEVKESVKVTLKLAKVGFQTAQSGLDKETTKKVTQIAKIVKNNPGLVERIKIAGHTDTRGSKEYNNILSQDRADAILMVFVQNGVDEKILQAVGYGFNRPLVKAETVDAWEKNRRTEIEFYGVSDRQKLNKMLGELK